MSCWGVVQLAGGHASTKQQYGPSKKHQSSPVFEMTEKRTSDENDIKIGYNITNDETDKTRSVNKECFFK
jgi:hypothetical protein